MFTCYSIDKVQVSDILCEPHETFIFYDLPFYCTKKVFVGYRHLSRGETHLLVLAVTSCSKHDLKPPSSPPPSPLGIGVGHAVTELSAPGTEVHEVTVAVLQGAQKSSSF